MQPRLDQATQLSSANFHLQNGNIGVASAQYEQILKLNPKCHEAHAGLAKILIRQYLIKKGIERLDQAIELAPNNVEYLMLRADHLKHLGIFDLAIIDYELIMTIAPNQPEVIANCAECYVKFAQKEMRGFTSAVFTKPLPLFLSGFKLNPALAPSCYEEFKRTFIHYFSSPQNATNAIEICNATIDYYPAFDKAYFHRAEALLALKDYESVKTNIATLLQLETDQNIKMLISKIMLRVCCKDQQYYKLTIPYIDNLLTSLVHTQDFTIEQWDILFELSRFFGALVDNTGKYRDLIEKIKTSVTKIINQSISKIPFADQYAYYTKAITTCPQAEQAYLLRANLYIRDDKYNEAMADLEKVRQINSLNMDVYLPRAKAYFAKQQFPEALSDILISLKHLYQSYKNSNDPELLNDALDLFKIFNEITTHISDHESIATIMEFKLAFRSEFVAYFTKRLEDKSEWLFFYNSPSTRPYYKIAASISSVYPTLAEPYLLKAINSLTTTSQNENVYQEAQANIQQAFQHGLTQDKIKHYLSAIISGAAPTSYYDRFFNKIRIMLERLPGLLSSSSISSTSVQIDNLPPATLHSPEFYLREIKPEPPTTPSFVTPEEPAIELPPVQPGNHSLSLQEQNGPAPLYPPEFYLKEVKKEPAATRKRKPQDKPLKKNKVARVEDRNQSQPEADIEPDIYVAQIVQGSTSTTSTVTTPFRAENTTAARQPSGIATMNVHAENRNTQNKSSIPDLGRSQYKKS